MPKDIRKGGEYSNVSETWNENEAQKAGGNGTGDAGTVSDDLQETIEAEAAEYDGANKGERLLDGDRATVKDEEGN